MSGETDLDTLLRTLEPVRRPGAWVFVSLPHDAAPDELDIEASVWEPEGRSVVVRRELADAQRLPYDYVAAWITLRVHSSLQAVGLTAAVSHALATAGLSCNVIAGAHHDHLLVGHHEAERALAVLRELALAAGDEAGS